MDCPIPADQLENYRKTVVRQPGQPQRIVTDSFQTLTKQQQNRLVEGHGWIGETWFKPKATARPVTTTVPNTTAKAIKAEHKAKTTTQDTQSEAQQPKPPQAPATRHTGKQTQREPTIPSTTEVDKTNDYWIKEGRRWKRARVKPRTTYYVPTQSDGGPNYDNLLPTRMTMVNPTNGSRGKRVDDNGTAEPQPEEPTQWTGSTNVEEKAQYKEQLVESDDEEHQPAIRAKAATTPCMPTRQQVQEHNLTQLPKKNWSPICVRGKGGTTNHPPQRSKQICRTSGLRIHQSTQPEANPGINSCRRPNRTARGSNDSFKQQLFHHATTCL